MHAPCLQSIIAIRFAKIHTDTLPDVELLAETKFLFSEDKSAAVHCWEDYGLNLHVPEGSSANFRVRVVHSKTFVLPKETELVSPFYWVTSEGELTGSVGVEIQHCVHITDKKGLSSLQFAAYKVEKPEPPYVFKECDSHFSMTSNYGRSDIKFSNWVFALLRSIKGMVCLKQRFQARLYYEPYHEPALQYECIAHLVIVPDTNACQVSAMFCSDCCCAYVWCNCIAVCTRAIRKHD